MKTFIAIITFFVSIVSYTQDTAYAHYIVRSLCSQPMAGRGYTNHEIDSAAYFIAQEFQKFGIRPLIKDNYFQPVQYQVNYFPKAQLTINGKVLIPGTDFIVSQFSPSKQGKFKTAYYLPKDTLFKVPKRFRNRFLLIPAYKLSKEMKNKLNSAYASVLNKCQGAITLDTMNFTAHVALYQPLYPKPLIKLSPTLTKSFIKTNEKISSVDINLSSIFTMYEANNVIAYVQGREILDTFIVITAHYDHLGRLDTAAFRGANDNASGVAMMLDLAKTISKSTFRPKYSVIFIAFAGEEVGLKGSFHFVNHPPIALSNIKFVINLDMVGTGSEGIGVVNGEIYPTYAKLLIAINEKHQYVPTIKLRGPSNNSDHAPFHLKKIPSFFIYTMGPEHPYYHQVEDKPDLPFTNYENVFSLIIDFIYAL